VFRLLLRTLHQILVDQLKVTHQYQNLNHNHEEPNRLV